MYQTQLCYIYCKWARFSRVVYIYALKISDYTQIIRRQKKKPKTCKKNGIRKLDEEKEKGREIFEEEED